MRSTRALFGAFSGGLVLSIAASFALLAVSSVVAFRGWPESDSAPKDPEVTQLRKARSAQAKEPKFVAVAALPKPAVASAPVRLAKAKAGPERKARHGKAQPVPRHKPAEKTRQQTGTSQAQPAAAPQQNAAPHPQGPATKANPVKPVSDGVRETTKAAADAVAPAAPAVSGALESVGAAGAETVDKVGDTAIQVVDTAAKAADGVLGGG